MRTLFATLPALTLAGTAVSATPRQPQKKQPNILYISCEDISCFVGCYGDPLAHTPNIDRLAREGVLFTNMYSSVGVSSPSRYALITGRYPSTDGANCHRNTGSGKPASIPDYQAMPPRGVRCYTNLLREAGYYCTNNVKTDYQFRVPDGAWDACSNKAHWRNRPSDTTPFFAVFNLGVTHESQLWLRENRPLEVDPTAIELPPFYPDDPRIRRMMAINYSNIAEMDRQVGRLIDQLREDGLYDDTIIVWFSDNGGPMPRYKTEIYDTGLQVPFVIRYPDKHDAGTHDTDLHCFIDVPATILSLADIETPAYMHGQAFAGAHATPAKREYVFAARDRIDETVDFIRGLRDKRYKYIRNFRPDLPRQGQHIGYKQGIDGMRRLCEMAAAGELDSVQMLWFAPTKPAEELYDLQNDPYEIHNVATNPAYGQILKRMRNDLCEYMIRINDKGFIPEAEWLERIHPNGKEQQIPQPAAERTADGKIVLHCDFEGATILYKDVQAESWKIYTKPLVPTPGSQTIAKCEHIGYKSSSEIRF